MLVIRLKFLKHILFISSILFFVSCHHHKKDQKIVRNSPTKSEKKPVPSKSKAAEKSDKKSDLEKKIGISSKELGQNKLYAFINDWYGTPYKYGGCAKNGVDCSCFANLLYEKVYGTGLSRSAADIYKACKEISLEEVEEGDLVFFKIGGRSITHVGIYLRKKYFVHSSTSSGVVISSVEEAYYKKYFFCAGKIQKG